MMTQANSALCLNPMLESSPRTGEKREAGLDGDLFVPLKQWQLDGLSTCNCAHVDVFADQYPGDGICVMFAHSM